MMYNKMTQTIFSSTLVLLFIQMTSKYLYLYYVPDTGKYLLSLLIFFWYELYDDLCHVNGMQVNYLRYQKCFHCEISF